MKILSSRVFTRLRKLRRFRFSQLRWRDHRWQLLIAVLLTAFAVLLFPSGQSFQFADLREGDVYMGDQIIAPFTFSIDKTPEEYARDKQLARASVYPVFVRQDSVTEAQTAQLRLFLGEIEKTLETLAPDSLKAWRLRETFAAHKIVISDKGLALLLNGFRRPPAAGISFKDYRAQLLRIARDLHSLGILNVERSALPEHVKKVSVRQGADELVEELDNLYGAGAVNNIVLQKLRELEGLDDTAVTIGYQILTAFVRPNLMYDEHDTNARIAEAVARVPLARGTVLQHERIIERHEKVTQEHLQKLRSLAAAKAARETSDGGWRRVLPFVGKILMVALSLGILFVYLRSRRDQLYWDLSRMLLLALILALVLFLAHLGNHYGLSEYLIPLAMAPMLLTVFLDAQVGFVGTVALAIILGSVRGNEFVTAFLCLVVGVAAILAVRRVRSRTWVLKAMLYLAVAYVLATAAIAFLLSSPVSRLGQNLFHGLLNALICPILTYGVMVILEYLFDVTTDATLLELSDLNRPLLRELALRAPGTYYHSILVGTLSEAAAEAIGANSLLARVGAYYHDIGKIEKPEYFVENQKGGRNPHEKLAPSMSCLVIINHVKRGVEIAEANALPRELRDFITQHHGTNLVTYFYKKAQAQSEDLEVQDSTFRYPGPKPQTKETGIVMLADAVEATARAFRDPSVSRIRHIVNQIVAERFSAGELDECPLTLRDLNQIKESFERTLNGIFHGRIQYGDDRGTMATRSETARERRSSSSTWHAADDDGSESGSVSTTHS